VSGSGVTNDFCRSVNSDEVQASFICNEEVEVNVMSLTYILSVIGLNLC
jgi:hypothetical protein